jgi:hypothetical protein
MKKLIFIYTLLFFCNSCSIQKSKDFDFIRTSYFENSKIREEIRYDSSLGTLFNRTIEKVVIKIDDNDKAEIYKLYKNLNLKSTSCCIKYEDGSSSKISFVLKNTLAKDEKCITNKEEIDKYLQLYIKFKNILRSKKEYKEAFPEEFETY